MGCCCCCSYASTEDDYLRVAIFGLENSGKTSLVHCLKAANRISETSKYNSTHGVIGINIHLHIPANINLLLFDCGGCKHQRHIWPHLFNNSDLILYTVDTNDLICLNDTKQALFDLLMDENLTNKPLLIVFTKSDKGTNINLNQLEQALDLFMIQDRLIHKVLFSSVTLDGLTSISAWLTYFNHRKLHGKELNIISHSQSFSSKHRIPESLNLTKLKSFSTGPSNAKKNDFLTVPKFGKRKTSSTLSKEKKTYS